MGVLSLLRPQHPAPLGSQAVGNLRGRLPAASPGGVRGLFAQVHYPAESASPIEGVKNVPWFRDEVIEAIATGYGISKGVLRSALAQAPQLDPPAEPLKAGRCPMVVFSSGIWGCCEMYTQLSREIAAHGYIVVAIEHEDGSGIFAESAATSETVSYVKPPKDLPSADIPGFRSPFLDKHAEELEAVAKSLAAAASEGAEKETAEEAALRRVLRSGDVERLLLIGHSMGASGAARYLRRVREAGRNSSYTGVFLLDLWGGCLEPEDLSQGFQVPYAMLFSEEWMSYSAAQMARHTAEASGERCLCAFEAKGTRHQWISESHFFGPAWLLRKIGIAGPADPRSALRSSVLLAQVALDALLQGSPRAEVEAKMAKIDPERLVSVF
eukprot:TRINITY_DN98776_c0_g1_i1.p1 TRINITY_DN98776_c0_g1~~TRINITY_DN98776_c0_g1_i1.p1  ORF type:complete len:383 (+),score=83.49 TRINITY_DN98776_c0_g1_i1:28-1176(+)